MGAVVSRARKASQLLVEGWLSALQACEWKTTLLSFPSWHGGAGEGQPPCQTARWCGAPSRSFAVILALSSRDSAICKPARAHTLWKTDVRSVFGVHTCSPHESGRCV